MSTLKITSKGQVTLRKDVLEHLGVGAGSHVTVNKLPDGRIEVSAAERDDIAGVFGFLKPKTNAALSIEEMNEITRQGWSGRRGKKA